MSERFRCTEYCQTARHALMMMIMYAFNAFVRRPLILIDFDLMTSHLWSSHTCIGRVDGQSSGRDQKEYIYRRHTVDLWHSARQTDAQKDHTNAHTTTYSKHEQGQQHHNNQTTHTKANPTNQPNERRHFYQNRALTVHADHFLTAHSTTKHNMTDICSSVLYYSTRIECIFGVYACVYYVECTNICCVCV